MDQLQSHLLELKAILADPNHDRTLVKTRTAWIKHDLNKLQHWSAQQTAPAPSAVFLDTLSTMQNEVGRDEMLDAIELQLMITLQVQATNYLPGH